MTKKCQLSWKTPKATKTIKSAIKQVKGAIGYLRRFKRDLGFLVDEKSFSIPICDVNLYTLVVVKELFDDDREHYSALILKAANEKPVQCVPFDYTDFYRLCRSIEGGTPSLKP